MNVLEEKWDTRKNFDFPGPRWDRDDAIHRSQVFPFSFFVSIYAYEVISRGHLQSNLHKNCTKEATGTLSKILMLRKIDVLTYLINKQDFCKIWDEYQL